MTPCLPCRATFLCLVLIGAVLANTGEADDGKSSSSVDAVRKALDQTVTLDYSSASLEDIVGHLKDRTKINLVIDQMVLQAGTIDFNPNGNLIHLKAARSKVRQVLQQLLNPYNLTYVILGETVLITNEGTAAQRQMRQRISLDVDNLPLHKALRDLARSHGVSLVVDPRVTKEAQAKVSLQLEDSALETGVRLLAEFANLKAVRLGNVLFVTTEEKAEKLRREETYNVGDVNGLLWPIPPGAFGGMPAAPQQPPPPPPPPPEKDQKEQAPKTP